MSRTLTNGNNIKALRRAWAGVKVISCADGTSYVKPRWRKQFRQHGVLTRLYVARMLQEFINGKLKHGEYGMKK